MLNASTHPPAPDLEHIRHSAHADALRQMRGVTPFAPALEREYRQAHLERTRPRLKMWFSLMVLLDISLATLQLPQDRVSDPLSWIPLVLLVPSAVMLTIVAWTALYYPFYSRVGTILVGIHSAALAVITAQLATIGLSTELGTQMVATFYFYGLLFRQATAMCVSVAVVFFSVCLYEGTPRGELTRDMIVLVVSGSICAALYWEMERSYRRSFLESRIISDLSARDGLTGLMNRRVFDERLLALWKQAMREERTLAVLMIDVDHFKSYNDTFGHMAGDVALRSIAQVTQQFARRPLDLVARYGGEEFAIILYDPAPAAVAEIMERLVLAVRTMKIPHAAPPNAAAAALSVSVGACVVVPNPARSMKALVRAADEALYEAKRAGRDRAVIKTPGQQLSHPGQAVGTLGSPESTVLPPAQ